jgi:hypothetical protein
VITSATDKGVVDLLCENKMWLDLRKGGTWSRKFFVRFCYHFEADNQTSTWTKSISHLVMELFLFPACTFCMEHWKPVSPFSIMREVPPFVKSYHKCLYAIASMHISNRKWASAWNTNHTRARYHRGQLVYVVLSRNLLSLRSKWSLSMSQKLASFLELTYR